MSREQVMTEAIKKPDRKALTDLQNVLRGRKQPTYPEITSFLREKRATERSQRNLALTIG